MNNIRNHGYVNIYSEQLEENLYFKVYKRYDEFCYNGETAFLPKLSYYAVVCQLGKFPHHQIVDKNEVFPEPRTGLKTKDGYNVYQVTNNLVRYSKFCVPTDSNGGYAIKETKNRYIWWQVDIPESELLKFIAPDLNRENFKKNYKETFVDDNSTFSVKFYSGRNSYPLDFGIDVYINGSTISRGTTDPMDENGNFKELESLKLKSGHEIFQVASEIYGNMVTYKGDFGLVVKKPNKIVRWGVELTEEDLINFLFK